MTEKANMKKYIISLDLGTTSGRCIVFDESGRQVSVSGKKIKCSYPRAGWVEQDADELSDAMTECVKKALADAGLCANDISAAGITNQRETVIVWDRRTGKPVHNALVWQCNRGTGCIDALGEEQKDLIRKKTGLIPSPYFSASKLAWILANVPEARSLAGSGHLAFGTPDSWLIYRLTGGRSHLTDYTNASRTLLFNIHTLEWDRDLLDIFNIPSSLLPEVRPSAGFFADTDEALLGGSIPICGVAGDQQSALFGQCCFDKGDVKTTYGTGCFMLMNTGDTSVDSKNGLLTTLSAQAVKDSPMYALEGSVFMCGALIDWLRDNLGVIGSPKETAELAGSVESTEGVYIVPAFTGLGAPYWKPEAKGLITGLTRGSDRRHIVRAALEAICYQCNDLLTAMKADTGLPISKIKADGGVTANEFLMQFQAGISRADVMIPENPESTALGAFFLAGLGCGIFEDVEKMQSLVRYGKNFTPEMDTEMREKLMEGWMTALKAT